MTDVLALDSYLSPVRSPPPLAHRMDSAQSPPARLIGGFFVRPERPATTHGSIWRPQPSPTRHIASEHRPIIAPLHEAEPRTPSPRMTRAEKEARELRRAREVLTPFEATRRSAAVRPVPLRRGVHGFTGHTKGKICREDVPRPSTSRSTDSDLRRLGSAIKTWLPGGGGVPTSTMKTTSAEAHDGAEVRAVACRLWAVGAAHAQLTFLPPLFSHGARTRTFILAAARRRLACSGTKRPSSV